VAGFRVVEVKCPGEGAEHFGRDADEVPRSVFA
jgi:hypothetical protein